MKQIKDKLELKEQDDFLSVLAKIDQLLDSQQSQLDKIKVINLGKSQLENKNRDLKLKLEDIVQQLESIKAERDLKMQHIKEQDAELSQMSLKVSQSLVFVQTSKEKEKEIDEWKVKSE